MVAAFQSSLPQRPAFSWKQDGKFDEVLLDGGISVNLTDIARAKFNLLQELQVDLKILLFGSNNAQDGLWDLAKGEEANNRTNGWSSFTNHSPKLLEYLYSSNLLSNIFFPFLSFPFWKQATPNQTKPNQTKPNQTKPN